MGNGYNQHHHQQQLYHHIRNGSSSFFLPILCKLSIKDVKLQSCKDPSSSSSSSKISGDNQNEPSSPKVSCMGQVQRNNRVIGFPTTYRPTSSTAITGPVNPKVKYTKLKKLFSGKKFTADREILKRSVTEVGSRKSSKLNDRGGSKINGVVGVNVSELDPPLPVVKKVKPPPANGGLWKRRSGGAALKTLQIQQIHLHTDNNLLQPTTV